MTRRLATWLFAMLAGTLVVTSLPRDAHALALNQIGLVRDQSNVRFQVEYVL